MLPQKMNQFYRHLKKNIILFISQMSLMVFDNFDLNYGLQNNKSGSRHANLRAGINCCDTDTQPETRSQKVFCRLVSLLSSSRYQDAFASLAPD